MVLGYLSSSQTRKLAHIVLLTVGAVGWFLPYFWVGAKLGPLPVRVPERLWQQYNTAGLFTRRCSIWSDWQLEVRPSGSTEWRLLEAQEVSPMPASGYRQRMDRILADTRSKRIGESLRQRLAGWIGQHLKERAGIEISGVRYYQRSWPTNTPLMAFPDGHWDGGGALPATTKVTLLGTYAIVDGKAAPEKAKPRVPGAVPQPKIFRRESAQKEPAKR